MGKKTNAVERLIQAMGTGGQSKLARRLGVTYQAVQQWVYSGHVPASRVIACEVASDGKVTRHDLRPDLYPKEAA